MSESHDYNLLEKTYIYLPSSFALIVLVYFIVVGGVFVFFLKLAKELRRQSAVLRTKRGAIIGGVAFK